MTTEPKFHLRAARYILVQGTYRGLNFDIKERYRCETDMERIDYDRAEKEPFTYYIHLIDGRFLKPEEFDNLWEIESEMDIDIPMHGGCTYLKKSDIDDNARRKYRCITIGCDYRHFFDYKKYYTLSDIKQDVKDTIDAIHDQYDYRVTFKK